MKTYGEVIDVITQPCETPTEEFSAKEGTVTTSEQTEFIPVIAFKDINGETITFTSDHHTTDAAEFMVGDKVEVKYPLENPNNCQHVDHLPEGALSSIGLLGTALLLFLTILYFLVIGV